MEVLILGAGGTGRDLVDWSEELRVAGRPLTYLGFLDDDPTKQGTSIAGLTVLGPISVAAQHPQVMLLDALGSPGSYRARAEALAGIAPGRFQTLIHPLARVSPSATIGVGSILYPFVFIGPDVRIGAHVTVLSHASINHDATIGEHTIVASHVALGGNVRIGRSAYLGMRATVREGCAVGAEAMVGMGAVVTADVPAGATVAGVPARPLKS